MGKWTAITRCSLEYQPQNSWRITTGQNLTPALSQTPCIHLSCLRHSDSPDTLIYIRGIFNQLLYPGDVDGCGAGRFRPACRPQGLAIQSAHCYVSYSSIYTYTQRHTRTSRDKYLHSSYTLSAAYTWDIDNRESVGVVVLVFPSCATLSHF